MRPKGLWYLADKGRRQSTPIKPKKAKALRTPQGYRATSTLTTSRGLGTLQVGIGALEPAVVAAAAEQIIEEIEMAGLA